MNLQWQEIGCDSRDIERIAHDGQKLFVEFKNGTGYYYDNVPYNIFVQILNKAYNDKTGKPSYGATLYVLVKKAGYHYERYK